MCRKRTSMRKSRRFCWAHVVAVWESALSGGRNPWPNPEGGRTIHDGKPGTVSLVLANSKQGRVVFNP